MMTDEIQELYHHYNGFKLDGFDNTNSLLRTLPYLCSMFRLDKMNY